MSIIDKLPGFGWMSVLKFIFKVLPIILVIGVFLYAFLVIVPQNAKLKDDLAEQAKVQQQLQEDFDTYKTNVDLLQAGVGAQATIRIQQETVRERYRDVPVEVTEKPFADDGMRTRAGILRDYQSSSPVFTKDDSSSR